MSSYVEEYVIKGMHYGIAKTPTSGTFTGWRGGCRITSEQPTMNDVRVLLHGYAVSQMRAEIGSAQRQLENAQAALDRLGNDPFHLGRFLK